MSDTEKAAMEAANPYVISSLHRETFNEGFLAGAEWQRQQGKVPDVPYSNYMPILGTPIAIRFDVLNERQARINHGQTLERLRERHGLSLCEAVAIADRRAWHRMEADKALEALIRIAAAPKGETK